MSAVLQTPPAPAQDVNVRLTFSKNLQIVTNKIHATSNIDEIMLEVSSDICNLFNADRLTIYTLGEDKQTIEEVYEPFLLKQGLILRTPRGRQLSEEAIRHIESR